ncbi:MAG: ABC transporter ATP-binding protein/permease [Duganella sp.]
MKYHLHNVGRPGFMQLVAPYWFSWHRWPALLQLAVLIAITVGGVKLHLWANHLAGDVTDALVALDWDALRPVLAFTVLAGLGVGVVGVVNSMLTQWLDLGWRTWLTNHLLEQWFRGHAYYDVEREGWLSNADQRIAEDVQQFVTQTIYIFTSLLLVVLNVAAFTAVLWGLSGVLRFTAGGMAFAIPGYMVYAAYIYNFGNFALVHWVGKRLVGLNNEKQGAEADYRYSAMQVRQNAEQIAFYGGGQREKDRLRQRFGAVRLNMIALIFRKAKVEFAHSAYGHAFSVLPMLLILPRYLAGEITLGGMTRVQLAYGSLGSSLTYFSQAYQAFAMWTALANRLRDLIWAMNKAAARQSGYTVQRAAQTSITTGVLQLADPQGRPLCSVAPLCFEPGSRWLLRGRSGAGKSTLLRVLAGLWPYGSGQVSLPEHASMMFLPQRSYLPAGPFKTTMCYPSPAEQYSDDACLRLLKLCGLDQRITSLSASDDWQQLLSGGEQQRVAFARALLHRPDFLFLDEATSALDDETQAMLYANLVSELPGSAIISVAHRSSLAEYHTLQLWIG